ncbi:putative lipid II flippase FtsW [Methyloraptor flagellatus]|uniref:Probable peptidoglycan glycosyltransferase FtsW n=1 Tax=Methyloraptor flagellatus TaxID=3162530 RepID=A0AAU7XDT6_9HYPH
MITRTDRSNFAEWWWTVDRSLIAAGIVLLIGGLVLSFAASPPVAERIGVADSFYFVKRHMFFFALALPVMIGVTFLSPRAIRRTALVMFGIGVLMLVATLFIGQEVKGARRWITLAGMSVQPSEFVKPAFIIVVAWLFADRQRRPEIPGHIFATLLLAVVLALLIAQPDIGQTLLTASAWAAVFFVAGMPLFWVMVGLGVAGGGLYAAYMFVPHVTSRVNHFLEKIRGEGKAIPGQPKSAGDFQAQQAHDSFLSGGWFGRGPGEGTVKRMLPDSHTDYIFAVVGEEYGIITCAVLAAVFAFIVFRGLWHANREEDPFIRYAIVGLVVLIGVQSGINMAVNLQLMPAKGMTLPFISYGGSSLLAIAFEMGALIALTRRRAQATRIAPPIHARPYVEAQAA